MKKLLDLYLFEKQKELESTTFHTVKCRCNAFLKAFENEGMTNWNQLNFEWCKILREMRKDWENPYSTFQILEQLNRFASWLTLNKYFDKHPLPLFWFGRKPQLPHRGTPSVQEVQELLEIAYSKATTPQGWRNFAIVALQSCTGIRPCEVRKLQVQNVQGEILEVEGKKGAWRTLVIEPKTAEILQHWTDVEREKYISNDWKCLWLFPSRTKHGMLKGLDRVFHEQIGTELDSSHLRHFFATQMELAGCPIEDLKQLMGHSLKSDSIHSYLHPTTEQIRNLKEKYLQFS